jgi:hypothetical protein
MVSLLDPEPSSLGKPAWIRSNPRSSLDYAWRAQASCARSVIACRSFYRPPYAEAQRVGRKARPGG